MLNIDKKIFTDNLFLTQEYCRLQIEKNQKDNATILRSYNPSRYFKKLFSFKVERFQFDIQPNINYCTTTKWTTEPIQSESVVDNLFVDQLNYKNKCLPTFDKSKLILGKILVSQIDYTVIDGASEAQSLGLIDVYDIPPIDTWFYLTKTKESRLLFAWIPDELVHYANEAVLVNCVDCINWFDESYPKEYEFLLTDKK